MMRFTVDESTIIPEYLIECMQLPEFKEQVLKRCKDAVNQSSINQQDVKSFTIPLAPISKQRELITLVEEIKKLLSLSLKDQAFSGRLSLHELEKIL